MPRQGVEKEAHPPDVSCGCSASFLISLVLKVGNESGGPRKREIKVMWPETCCGRPLPDEHGAVLNATVGCTESWSAVDGPGTGHQSRDCIDYPTLAEDLCQGGQQMGLLSISACFYLVYNPGHKLSLRYGQVGMRLTCTFVACGCGLLIGPGCVRSWAMTMAAINAQNKNQHHHIDIILLT